MQALPESTPNTCPLSGSRAGCQLVGASSEKSTRTAALRPPVVIRSTG